MKPRLSPVFLGVLFAASLLADVSYVETLRNTSFDHRGPQSRVPSVEPPVFDIPASLYSPPFKHALTKTFQVFVKGDKLARVGDDKSTIYDLDAGTVTTVLRSAHTYTVETFAEAHQRLQEQLARWKSVMGAQTYSAVVQKTGQTSSIDGQLAEEYRIVGIGRLHGKYRVAGSAVYWTVPKAPSDQLADFMKKWAQKCPLPYPSGVSTEDNSVFGVMSKAAAQLAGFPVLYVVESRPPANSGMEIRPEAYEASRSEISQQPITGSESLFAFEVTKIRATETSLSSFAADSLDDDVFAIPARYKQKKGSGYMP